MIALKELRESKGYKKYKVSQLLGISQSAYFHMEETTQAFKASMVKKLAQIFGVSVEYLIELMAENEGK